MSTFPDKVYALRHVVTARHSTSDGGWPHRLDVDNAASSIVSTAHVLEMLRAWNYEFRDPPVQAGLAYLARAVQEHTKPKSLQGTGRGEFCRYPAFALWGLTRFPQAPFSDDLRQGLRFSLAWLSRHRLPSGGWAMEAEGDLSFTVTTPAVHALDRIKVHPEYGKAATELAALARKAIVRANRGTKRQPWWTPYGETARPSGAATALAVLALAGGSEQERELARGGISWLLNHPSEWVASTETDMSVEDRSWQMMSFSLGMRAVLHPCAKETPNEAIYRQAIQYWDELWVEKAGAWAHHPGAIPSTTGSFGVIVAVRAVKRAFPFDPAQHLGVNARTRRTGSPRALPRPRLTIELMPARQFVRIANQQSVTVVETEVKGPAQWKVLETVAFHHLKAAEANDQLAQTISLAELAQKVGSSEQACAKALNRLNALLTKRANQNHSQFLPSLIEDISPTGSQGSRYGLEEVDVVALEDESP